MTNDQRMVQVELLRQLLNYLSWDGYDGPQNGAALDLGKELRALISGPGVEPVMLVVRNDAGQISLVDSSGNAFDMSKHVGDSFYLAAPSAPVHAVPDWQWVPKEPTPEMVLAIDNVMWPGASKKAYIAMLAAAPQPPKESKQDGFYDEGGIGHDLAI